MKDKKENFVLLGSTGSIGNSAEEVLRETPGRFNVAALAAGRGNGKLAEQAAEFNPGIIAVRDRAEAETFKQRINNKDTEIVFGAEGLVQTVLNSNADMVLNALSGAAGIRPSLACVDAGIKLLLANKEALVAAGEIIMASTKKSGAQIIPVDSEHSAVFQCLQGESASSIKNIIITASGGPFFRKEISTEITPEMALKHPTWNMGPKVTIDSATLFNKGLEIIEAMWLFDLPLEKIKVVVHPESIVHSMVEFVDGVTKAQMSYPDMKGPIRYAIHYPERSRFGNEPGMDFSRTESLTFYEPDLSKYPCLELAVAAATEMGLLPAMLSAADEIAVEAFLKGMIHFHDIPVIIEKVLEKGRSCGMASETVTLESVLEADSRARVIGEEVIKTL